MIVLGADMHKQTHTVAGIAAATGELLGEKTVAGRRCGVPRVVGLGAVARRGSGLGVEDCRHVSGSLERS